MPSYKLYYFNARGAGELARLLFKLAGQEFEDIRFEGEEWPKHKAGMPMKAMPVLEVDGKKICQSQAIARYLAREFGLMGSNNLEALRIEEVQEMCSEMMSKEVTKIFSEKDEEKKKGLIKEFVEEGLPKYQDFLVMRLKEQNGGKGYLLDKLSLGDLLIYNMNTFLKMFGVDLCKDQPLLKALCDRVGNEPKIADWVKKRPDTKF